MGKSLTAIFIGCLLSTTLWAAGGSAPPGPELFIRVDWQEPTQLPPQSRNHCTVENFTARPYARFTAGGTTNSTIVRQLPLPAVI
jgi:hypothetical protein